MGTATTAKAADDTVVTFRLYYSKEVYTDFDIPFSKLDLPLTYGKLFDQSVIVGGYGKAGMLQESVKVANYVPTHIWEPVQGVQMMEPFMSDTSPAMSDAEVSNMVADNQVLDVAQFDQDMQKTPTYDANAADIKIDYTLPLKEPNMTMQVTYQMADGSDLPASVTDISDNPTSDTKTTATKTIKGFEGETYQDTPHYLIPQVAGYTANVNTVTFTQDGTDATKAKPVTITYTKNSPKNAVATPSEPKPVKTLFKVYGKRGLYRYRHVDFKKAERLHHYVKKPRMYAPVFDVVGTATSKAGNPRYLLRDGSYITAKKAFVNKLYWQGAQTTLYVTSPKGTNLYQEMPLTTKVRHLKQGSSVQVVKLVKKGYLTRYQLADGTYITGNKQLVSPTKPKEVTKIKAKANINLYRDVDLQHRIKRITKGQTVTVKGWDYSFGGITGMTGSKRYKVAGGYISANKALVKVMK
ncbi:DUF5776 domain-containing protein [Levilactobacillus paucivorans]|nr:DUF5776 domain-containing protein [Levilactobacillus paucivorans]